MTKRKSLVGAMRKRKSTYKPHNAPSSQPSGPPARVSGRTRAVLLIEGLLSKCENLVKLDQAFQAEFDRDPTRFYRTYIVPFLPKDSRGVAEVKLPIVIHFTNTPAPGPQAQAVLDVSLEALPRDMGMEEPELSGRAGGGATCVGL